LFELAWETGARPDELFRLESRHFQKSAVSSTWVFSPEESKIRSASRVVYLSPKAVEITERLISECSSGPLLKNTRGNPWNNYSTDCVLKRLHRAGLPKHDLYGWRHGFAVRHFNSGTDCLLIATLMGHKSLKMLKDTYGHLMENRSLLAKAVGYQAGDSPLKITT
jgi:integrase